MHIVSQLVSVPAGQCTEASLYAISDNTNTVLSRNTPLDAIIVGCICYVFELNRNMNSKWEIFGLCHYCIQLAILPSVACPALRHFLHIIS